MKFLRILIHSCLLTLIPAILSAQAKSDTIKLSLQQAQEYALQNNKSILNANLDMESARKKVWETTAIGLPQVSSAVSASYILTMPGFFEQFLTPSIAGAYSKIPANERPADSAKFVHDQVKKALDDMRFSGTWDLTVSQLIFSGSYLVGLQSAKVYKSLSSLNQVKSAQDVLESITNSYFTVLVAKENEIILDSTWRNVKRTLEEITQMNKSGFVEETDVDQMKITLSNIKSSLDLIRRQHDIAEKLLKIQLGIGFDSNIQLTDNLNSLISSMTTDKLLAADFILESNVNYQMLDAQVKSSELLLKLQKSQCLPDVAAFYQHEELLNSKSISFTPPDMIGLKISIPIFASGSRYAKIAQAKMDLQKAMNNRDQNADMIRLQYYQSKSSLVASLEKYENDKQNIELSGKIYNKALVKYRNGMISSTDLTQTQNQFLNSQSGYYQSILNLITEKNKLEKLLTKN